MLPHAQAYAKVNLYFDSSFNIFTVMMKRRIACSLIFLLHTLHIGAGSYNGYGGKIEDGKTMLNCAIRELEEESGIMLSAEDLFM